MSDQKAIITFFNPIKFSMFNNMMSHMLLIKNFKLKDVLNANEAFVTGTFANIIPVKKINNKSYNLKNNLITKKIRELYLQLMDK